MEFDRGKRLWTRICMALLAVYVALFAFNAMTRTREFDDPELLVDAAIRGLRRVAAEGTSASH